MSDYLCKYVGKYRVLAEYDKSTNYWIVDSEGNLDKTFDDFYIPLKNNVGRIMHYDRDVLIIYINGLRKAHAIIKNIENDYKIKEINKSDIIQKIRYTDDEALIYIKDGQLPKFIPYLNPVTKGNKIRPFSSQNLPKQEYEIPKQDLDEYLKLVSNLDKKSKLDIGRLSKHFVSNIRSYKESGLDIKSFIHKSGNWKKYLNYLQEKLDLSDKL